MEVLFYVVPLVVVPALGIGGIASAVAHWRAKRRGESTEEIGRRIRRAFWLAFLIAAAIETIAFGLCISALG